MHTDKKADTIVSSMISMPISMNCVSYGKKINHIPRITDLPHVKTS